MTFSQSSAVKQYCTCECLSGTVGTLWKWTHMRCSFAPKKDRKSDCDTSWQHFLNHSAKVTAMSSSHYSFLYISKFLCTIFVQLLHANVRLSILRDSALSQAFNNPGWWNLSFEGSRIWSWICGEHLTICSVRFPAAEVSENFMKYFAWSSTQKIRSQIFQSMNPINPNGVTCICCPFSFN